MRKKGKNCWTSSTSIKNNNLDLSLKKVTKYFKLTSSHKNLTDDTTGGKKSTYFIQFQALPSLY